MPLFGRYVAVTDKVHLSIFKHFDSRTLHTVHFLNREWLSAVQAFLHRRRMYASIFEDNETFAAFTLTNFDCQQLSGGMTNLTFVVQLESEHYVVRMPGKETSQFINRHAESYNARLMSQLGINAPIMYADANDGTQVTTFLEDSVVLSKERLKQPLYLQSAVMALNWVHRSGKVFANSIDVFARNERMLSLLNERHVALSSRYADITSRMPAIQSQVKALALPIAPCHNDTTPPNFLFSNHKMHLIDWEYSGNNLALWDLVCMAMEGEFDAAQIEMMLTAYYVHVSELVRSGFTLLAPVYEYWTSLWAQVQLAMGNSVEGVAAYQTMAEKRITHCETLMASPEFIRRSKPGFFAPAQGGRQVLHQTIIEGGLTPK